MAGAPEEMNMSNHARNVLLTPYQLGDLRLRNRIVMAPLTRTRAENAGHIPNELMVEYYSQRASAGLIIIEGTCVPECIKTRSMGDINHRWSNY